VRALKLALALLACVGCEAAYPEIVVANRTADHIQIRNPSFSGCAWDTVLLRDQTTAVARCLPGTDHVYFQKLDLSAATPTWFNYRTGSTWRVDYGDFRVLDVSLDDMEQDFSVPGPYGH
jgi:hypothetical protein